MFRKLESEKPSFEDIEQEVAKGCSVERKLIWKYLAAEAPLHHRRTLDQFGYPHLSSTRIRDGDQMLYKRTILKRYGRLGKRERPLNSWKWTLR
jgi:hypothetical protein